LDVSKDAPKATQNTVNNRCLEPAVICLNYMLVTQNLTTKINYDIPESIRRRREMFL
jgi:hypothetical protein